MIVDTSAILAILFSESDAETYASAIDEADACRISAANFVEAAIIVEAQTRDSVTRAAPRVFGGSVINVTPRAAVHRVPTEVRRCRYRGVTMTSEV